MIKTIFDYQNSPGSWTVEQAKQHYNLAYWSNQYFDLNEAGRVVVYPEPENKAYSIELSELCKTLRSKDLHMPVLLRFIDILKHQVKSLCKAFNEAMASCDYQGNYSVCYPIKVNQQRRVVEGLVKANLHLESPQVGLEAGSKPELMAVLALSEKTNSKIVCNGYKDREYLRAALIATELGHNVYIVIEKISELELLLEESANMKIKPRIGVRVKLATKGESKWQDSGGEHSKFGLSTSQILHLINKISAVKQIDIFQLLHFHLGSQLTSIQDIQNGLQECARFYAELRMLGIPVDTVDVGGGLGVDYEGTQSQSHCSMNYTIEEYANNVVSAFYDIAEKMNLPHPSIISESGRALTAHHAVLITNVIDSEKPKVLDIEEPSSDCHMTIKNLWDTLSEAKQTSDNNKLVECYHNADYLLKQVQQVFNHGLIGLAERALAERIQRSILFKVRERINPEIPIHQEVIDELQRQLASKFFVNFSIFQSLPDAWAINQVFPLMPLQGLDSVPEETAIIQDITCDSDGMLKQYVNAQAVMPTIDLPTHHEGDDYLLGVFLVGAYQEILGDMHNLFGDTHTVDLELNSNGELNITANQRGSSVEELLDYVDFDAKSLLESYRRQLKLSELPQSSQRQYLAELRQGIYGYSYLEE
ncbi:biosynthetic arginine decarboxylase [Aliikangiella sp. IMCC44359]|uniref:biosynthetic arginine decarboxylase n=1 Tax=Aliikangiella sp. IMCC44359 TaxID=3459125 RepID=UPI00403AB750